MKRLLSVLCAFLCAHSFFQLDARMSHANGGKKEKDYCQTMYEQ